MTTTISYANATDGYILSNAYAGPAASATTGATTLTWDGDNAGPDPLVAYESFMEFPYTLDLTQAVTAAYIRVKAESSTTTSTSRNLEIREYDWGGSLTTADWRTPAQFGALTLLGQISNGEDASTSYMMAGSDALVTRLATTGTVRVVAASDRLRLQTISGFCTNTFSSADESGTPSDPALVFTSTSKSRLFGVLGAQAQLSDGTHVYLESQNETGTWVLLKHHNGTSASTIASVIGGSGDQFSSAVSGAQSLAVCVDSSDNIYIVGAWSAFQPTTVAAVAFVKGVGYSWTGKPYLTASLPSYTDGRMNNFASAWHNVGTNGTIMAVASHTAGRTPDNDNDIVYALLNCQSLLAGSGTLLRNSGSGRDHGSTGGWVVANPGRFDYYTNYANETGALLDVVSAPGTSDRGYVSCTNGSARLGGTDEWFSTVRYVLAPGGTSISDSDSNYNPTLLQYTKDASAKGRVIGIDGSTFISVCADPNFSYGISVEVMQNFGTAVSFSTLGRVRLGTSGPASMPSVAAMATSSAWDAVYDPSGNKVWVYYLDVADGNRLMKTSIDMNTYLAAGDAVQVSAAIGAAGSTNYAIRVHRGKTNGQKVLVSVVSKTSGGVYSTIYVVDSLNQAPNAPTLTAKANYDATQAATFSWTFSDPNAGDTQSAYQLQIVDVSDSSVDVDTGKVTSGTSSRSVTGGTLVNGKSYQWRVATWDALDAAGPYSSYGTFSTSAGGSVTVTNPAADNPTGVNTDDYTIQWSVSGTTQAAYRVVVTRTSTGATLVNTGYVTSTATSYNVAGMLTGVEYTVAVTVRNSALVESGTGTRKITPDYDNVPQPTVSVTSSAAGYITVNVTNGVPTGDNPAATSNQILRRRADSTGAYTVIATIDPDSSYDDYAVASGVTYEYIARAVA